MDFSHYNDQPVQTAVDLVNTFDWADDTENLSTVEDLEEFVQTHSSGWDYGQFDPTDRDLHEVRALRSRLREVFVAGSEEQAARVLNGILEDTNAVPRISVHGAGPHLHFESNANGIARWLGAVTAVGLSVALIEGGYERFGRCCSKTCDDVFVDVSRNKSKRHCSDTCTTRENVAAYRARQSAD